MSVYRTEEGRRHLLQLYEETLARIPAEVERRQILTEFGMTHVLVAGPKDGPPVVVHQGGNSPSPVTLLWFIALFRRFRVYAPDLPGSPGYSEPEHLATRPGGLEQWPLQVLDALGIDRALHMGASYGAGVILAAAAKAEGRISGMALLMPAGIARPPIWTLMRELAVPMLRYRLRSTPENLRAAVRSLHTDPPDDLLLRVHAAIFQHLRQVRTMAAPRDPAALARARIPALVVAGERDPLFPAAALVRGLPQVLPEARTLILKGTRHFPSAQDQEEISRAILEFATSSG